MILIDGPMPKRCSECPCFDDSVYGRCRVNDAWLDANDGAWFSERRPSWCPLREVTLCKDCQFHATHSCSIEDGKANPTPDDWFCAGGRKKDG